MLIAASPQPADEGGAPVVPTGVSLSKVFNKRVGQIVVNGKRTGRATSSDASSSWTLKYKITLTRRH